MFWHQKKDTLLDRRSEAHTIANNNTVIELRPKWSIKSKTQRPHFRIRYQYKTNEVREGQRLWDEQQQEGIEVHLKQLTERGGLELEVLKYHNG